jgi:cytochrome c oxidase accessory protein FixG
VLDHLFAAKKRLYPQKAKGRFRRLKWILNCVFLSIYFLTPFLRFDRGEGAPNQAILIDFTDNKAYFFNIEIWPQEVYYLAGILIIAAVALFFITSLFGRIWCGYACFQTVWTDIFIALEHLFQGDRNQRIILDRKNNFKKFWQKGLTHFSWIIVSILTGYGFVCYFNDAIFFTKNIFHGKIDFTSLGWIIGIAGSTYIMAGFAREHVCTYMCPYSRFQSAMFDKNTLIITYDEKRGEPRNKLVKESNLAEKKGQGKGDCIDCKQCVVVCPTGIDIRNGLQMECIACGLCVDACDEVMEKIGRPKGLIRYDTLDHLANPIPSKKFKILKPRTFFYATILTLVCSLMLRSLLLKPVLEVDAIPDRNPLFVKLSDGSIRNGYTIKIMNKTHEKKTFSLKIIRPIEAMLKLQAFDGADLEHLVVLADDVGTFKVYTILPKEFLAKNSEGRGLVDFVIDDTNGNEVKNIEAVFIWK